MEERDEKERQRSPNYPAFGLSTAVERARALYDRDGKAAVPTLSAVKAWGYNSLNGRSMRALGALRQYGLLDDAGPKMVRLSQRALAIILAPAAGSLQRTRALEEAAKTPGAFAELYAQYPDGFPSDESMVHNLTINTNFSEDAARVLIAAFRDTIDLVSRAQASDTSPDKQDSGRRGEEKAPPPDQTPKKKENNMPVLDATQSQDLMLPVGSGRIAILRVPMPFTENEWKLMNAVLAAMKPGLVSEPVEASVKNGREET